MRLLVTGGAGFIGSYYVRSALSGRYLALADAEVVVFDLLTYAGTLTNLAAVLDSPRLRFVFGLLSQPGAPEAPEEPAAPTDAAEERDELVEKAKELFGAEHVKVMD